MDKFISAVQNWPVLVQGAIGSAIFWLILLIGQRATGFFSKIARDRAEGNQESHLFNELLRHRAVRDATHPESTADFASLLWYRASRKLIVGLIWLSLGLMFSEVAQAFGVVGFIGCIFNLFGALNVVKPLNVEGDIDEKIGQFEAKLENLDKLRQDGKKGTSP